MHAHAAASVSPGLQDVLPCMSTGGHGVGEAVRPLDAALPAALA